MKNQSDENNEFEKIIGLGESSFKKSYYPELKKQIQNLERANEELRHQIEERQKAEEANELSIISFKQLFNSSTEGIVIRDVETGDIVDVNDATLNIYGYNSKDELINSSSIDLSSNIEQYTSDNAKKHYQDAVNGEDQFFEWLAKRSDGENFWIEVSLKKRNIYGKPRLLAIIRDISERKKQELIIKENEELLRKLIVNSPLGMHFYELYEDDLMFSFANSSADKILGIEHSNLIGKTILDAFPNLSETIIPDIYKKIARQGGVWSDENIVYSEGKISGAYEVIAFQTKENKMVAIFNDITQRKVAEHKLKNLNLELESRVHQRTEELQKALDRLNDSNYELLALNEKITDDSHKIIQLNEKLLETQDELKGIIDSKNKFFSIIAHDLKGPFSGFIGLTDLLAKETDELSVREIKKLSNLVNNAANSIYKLLEDLLEWSRFQMGSIPFTPLQFDLYELAFNTVFTFNDIALAKNIKLKLLFDKRISAFGDRNMITTVLRNLTSNAIKFTNPEGIVEIGICDDKASDYVCMFVRDNGVGIPNEYLDKIFEIDRNYKTSGTAKETGTGLGLALCKEFVEKNYGKIWVESTEGKGSTFYFTMPSNDIVFQKNIKV